MKLGRLVSFGVITVLLAALAAIVVIPSESNDAGEFRRVFAQVDPQSFDEVYASPLGLAPSCANPCWDWSSVVVIDDKIVVVEQKTARAGPANKELRLGETIALSIIIGGFVIFLARGCWQSLRNR